MKKIIKTGITLVMLSSLFIPTNIMAVDEEETPVTYEIPETPAPVEAPEEVIPEEQPDVPEEIVEPEVPEEPEEVEEGQILLSGSYLFEDIGNADKRPEFIEVFIYGNGKLKTSKKIFLEKVTENLQGNWVISVPEKTEKGKKIKYVVKYTASVPGYVQRMENGYKIFTFVSEDYIEEDKTIKAPSLTPSFTRATQEIIDKYVKPDFSNMEAYGYLNPYTARSMGQCTWYTWGRFYEVYGYSPGFVGNGCDAVSQLLSNQSKSEWEGSLVPIIGSIFSADFDHNHVGMIVGIEGDLYVVQEGNLDHRNNSMAEVEEDCWTQTYTLEQLFASYGKVTFANPVNPPETDKLIVKKEENKEKEAPAQKIIVKSSVSNFDIHSTRRLLKVDSLKAEKEAEVVVEKKENKSLPTHIADYLKDNK